MMKIAEYEIVATTVLQTFSGWLRESEPKANSSISIVLM